MIAKLCAEVERLKEVVNLQVENYAELKEQNEAQHGYFNSVMQERDALQAEVKHLNLHLKATQSGRDSALARLSEIEAQESVATVLLHEGEKIIDGTMAFMDTAWLGMPLFASAGASPVEPSQEWKPALSPATISTAPAYLNTNDKAMWVLGWNECLNAQPPAPSEAAREYMTGYSDGREWAAAPQPKESK